MNILIHLVILLIFVFALLMLNIPTLRDDQYIQTKIYIFSGIFLFEFIISLFIMIQRNCVINLSRIGKSSLESALFGVIAYSVYNDLVWTGNAWASYDSDVKRNMVISIMITLFIAVGYFLEVIFTDMAPGMNDCLNKLYKEKNE